LKAAGFPTRYNVLALSGAFLLGVFLMVDDELFTYMSLGVPKYQFPVLGYFALWDAWALDFGFIVVSVALMMVGIYKSR
jgi:hypothetical protein